MWVVKFVDVLCVVVLLTFWSVRGECFFFLSCLVHVLRCSCRIYTILYSLDIIISQIIFLTYIIYIYIYRVSQEECARLRESVPYVKVYRYNPKHLYPKLNSYGDNGQRKLWSSCGSTYCTCPADAVSWAGTVRIQSTARTLNSVM